MSELKLTVQRSYDNLGTHLGNPLPWRAFGRILSNGLMLKLGGPRAVTPWEAVRKLLEEYRATEARYGSADGEVGQDQEPLPVAEAGDGRYIPSRDVHHSKPKERAMDDKEKDEAVKALVEASRRALAKGGIRKRGERVALEEALLAFMDDDRDAERKLPWEAIEPIDEGERDWQVIDSDGNAIASFLSEEMALLIVNSAAMAKMLDNWLERAYLDDDRVEELLIKAAWVKG